MCKQPESQLITAQVYWVITILYSAFLGSLIPASLVVPDFVAFEYHRSFYAVIEIEDAFMGEKISSISRFCPSRESSKNYIEQDRNNSEIFVTMPSVMFPCVFDRKHLMTDHLLATEHNKIYPLKVSLHNY